MDAPNRRGTREVLHTLCDRHIRHGWIGRQLACHYARLGLTAVEIRPVTLVLQSLRVATEVLGLGDAAPAGWLQQLEERDRQGAFLASLTVFTVKGRVRARSAV